MIYWIQDIDWHKNLQVVGRLASYKGIPVLTGLGDVISGERSTYSTLIRASYDLWDEAKAILAFLSHLDWYHFGLIYRSKDVYYSTLAEELLNLLNSPKYSDRFTCTCKDTYVRDANKTILTDLEKVIDYMTNCARSKSFDSMFITLHWLSMRTFKYNSSERWKINFFSFIFQPFVHFEWTRYILNELFNDRQNIFKMNF